MPLQLESPPLRCYWISFVWPKREGPGFTVGLDQPIGIGVTAFGMEDARELVVKEGAARYFEGAEKVEWFEITEFSQLEGKLFRNHLLPNSGPLYFRGVWSGHLNLGFGASGQRQNGTDPSTSSG